jgi:hypothetical protein
MHAFLLIIVGPHVLPNAIIKESFQFIRGGRGGERERERWLNKTGIKNKVNH